MYLKFLAAMLKEGKKEETDNFNNIFNSHIKYYHRNM